MPLKPDRLGRSLQLAQDSLSRYETQLTEAGVEKDLWRKNPRWRNLNSDAKQIQNRIDSANALITRGERPVQEEAAEE